MSIMEQMLPTLLKVAAANPTVQAQLAEGLELARKTYAEFLAIRMRLDAIEAKMNNPPVVHSAEIIPLETRRE